MFDRVLNTLLIFIRNSKWVHFKQINNIELIYVSDFLQNFYLLICNRWNSDLGFEMNATFVNKFQR